MKFRNSIEIKEPSDWELVASDVLDEFLEDFSEREGLTEPCCDEDFDWVLTERGEELYERMIERLNKLGRKIFHGETFSYAPTGMNWY